MVAAESGGVREPVQAALDRPVSERIRGTVRSGPMLSHYFIADESVCDTYYLSINKADSGFACDASKKHGTRTPTATARKAEHHLHNPMGREIMSIKISSGTVLVKAEILPHRPDRRYMRLQLKGATCRNGATGAISVTADELWAASSCASTGVAERPPLSPSRQWLHREPHSTRCKSRAVSLGELCGPTA
ncbi:uncharacterized protein BDZ99DRAFT_473646 [Mytilinidion resinicola]|uniref:Uncharacterized protein n=1 Tax=Mytilinidion resinicola TaxID=574789 RepID=A0A6A6YWF8_9PEZI|nr:uncharacterized protein BDZ99DRAFT_473646 [Mytilinidion resinicola]KAF2812888.1 hypothetical protein BDZ99DRAFT_473646 [Mytilinidion resinicola]